MTPSDSQNPFRHGLTDEQLQAAQERAERKQQEAYERGLADGRKQWFSEVLAILRGVRRSWTMGAGVLIVVAGAAIDLWPMAHDVLRPYISPEAAEFIGVAVMLLRAKTGKPLAQR